MSCELLRSTLLDAALGAPIPAALQSHLDLCASCRTALERERGALARIDGQIRGLMAATPSVAMVPRVRQRLAEGAAIRPRPLVVWLLPMAAVVGLLSIGLFFARRAPSERADRPTQSLAETTKVAPTPYEGPQRLDPTTPPPRPVRVAFARPVRPSEPEVLIPQEDQIALARYHERLRHKRVTWLSFRAGQPRNIDVLPTVATIDDAHIRIFVQSIDIAPLVAPAIEQESPL